MTCMFYCDFTNGRSAFLLNKCQVFTGPQQFRKNIKRRLLFGDDTYNLVPRLGQLMAHEFFMDVPWSCLTLSNIAFFMNVPWSCLIFTLVLSKCQHFTRLRQFEKEIKQRLFRDTTDNLVLRFGQLHEFYSAPTMITPEFVRLLS